MINLKDLKNKMIDEIIDDKGLDIAVVNAFEKVSKDKQIDFVLNGMNKQMIKKMHEPIYLDFDTIGTKKEAKDLIDADNNYYVEDDCLGYVDNDLSTKFCGIIKMEDK